MEINIHMMNTIRTKMNMIKFNADCFMQYGNTPDTFQVTKKITHIKEAGFFTTTNKIITEYEARTFNDYYNDILQRREFILKLFMIILIILIVICTPKNAIIAYNKNIIVFLLIILCMMYLVVRISINKNQPINEKKKKI